MQGKMVSVKENGFVIIDISIGLFFSPHSQLFFIDYGEQCRVFTGNRKSNFEAWADRIVVTMLAEEL
jgi:hypothetical protein